MPKVASVAMLSRPLALHNPNCSGICAPGDCIENVEAFANSVLEKFYRGERVGHEPGSHAFLSGADREDALAYLVESCWQAWRDFRAEDDGRASSSATRLRRSSDGYLDP